MCEVLDLERKGVRDEIAERILDFCLCPKDSGKGIPASKKRKSKILYLDSYCGIIYSRFTGNDYLPVSNDF